MPGRLARVVIALTSLTAPFAATAKAAPFAPVSQDRFLSASVSGSYTDAQGVSIPPPAEQKQSATDFGPFSAAVANGFAVPAGAPGSAVSSASQSSQLGPQLITAGGDAGVTAARFQSPANPQNQYNYSGIAGTTFDYLFSVSAPTAVALSGMIHTDTTEGFAENAIVVVSLSTTSGVELARFAAPSVGVHSVPPEYDAPVAFTGTLSPGQYSLFAMSSATPFLVPGADSETQHASFQIALQPVPEPSVELAATLVIIGTIVRRRSRCRWPTSRRT